MCMQGRQETDYLIGTDNNNNEISDFSWLLLLLMRFIDKIDPRLVYLLQKSA